MAEYMVEQAERAIASPHVDARLLQAMVESVQDGVCLLGPGGRLLHANRAACEMLVLEPWAWGDDLRALSASTGFDWSVAEEVIARKLAVSVVQTLGDGRKVLVSATPSLSGRGEVDHIVLVLRDVTGFGQAMSRLQEAADLAGSENVSGPSRGRAIQPGEIVAGSRAMRAVREKAVRYAAVDSAVLLLGETGTGKGVFARLVHQSSPRAGGPFVEVNCGAIPDGLLEAELFGYVRGAFTGADPRGKGGLIELAHRGTLLLNEVGDLPVPLQVKLLRFLEDGEVWPVGAVRPRRPDVRIVAATNRDLARMIAEGAFRGDLYYRLNVLTLQIPPLRERPEDIPALIEMMLEHLAGRLRRCPPIAADALDAIRQYPFPGNVRELWNLVERLVVTAMGDTIQRSDLPPEVMPRGPGGSAGPATLREAIEALERQMIGEALARYRTQALAARHLGVTQSTVARKAKQLRLAAPAS
ncbi:MAG TPA: sigma 54-interacting transcriptional regulator [Candidatus Binatia bacterium]|nr:sigma 54-interacting transcriptional regulator [Candidatus Binatia bacterium]